LKGNQSPGFYFSAFVLAMVAALLLAALVSPAVQDLIAPIRPSALHRIFSRLAELSLFIGTWWLLRGLDLWDRRLMGYGAPPREFIRRLGLAFVGGLAMMALTVLPLFALDLRELRPDLGSLGEILLTHGPRAVLTGLSVALIEETFFRGALQGAMSRSGATASALFLVPVLYAAVHFLGDAVRIPPEEAQWWSGFVILRSFFAAFASPREIADAFLALYLVGVLLALVRRRWGDIAGCIGLHAGFVAVISLLRSVSVHTDAGRWSWLVGPFDGLLGLWIAAVSALACVLFWLWPGRNQKGFAITK
jgi:membrane protease YdiL (CAAX protease family)